MAKKLTSAKAKEILHDKSVHGHPLTDKQRRFFGAIAGGATPMKDGGWLDSYPEAQNGIEGTMGGLTDKGFNYNGAWGGTMQMGGSLPGSVGFMYARTQSPAPSNGPYAKKTKASAQNGMEMKYYQEGLDWKPKTISKDGGWLSKYDDGGVIEDDMGQWAHPGLVTKINSNQITMKGVGYPVLGISDTGDTKIMQPDQDYSFDGSSVTEYPMMKDGGSTATRTVCPSCGWSWKKSEGGSDPYVCHNCGMNNASKLQGGGPVRDGYGDPDYVTGTSRHALNKMIGMGNYLVPASALNRAADLAKTKGLDYGATTSGPADAVRHAAAAASVASRLPIPQFIQEYSPALDRAMRITGANLLGIGHEIMSPNSEGFLMDIRNNYQGSLIGSIPGLTEAERNKMIVNQLQSGRLKVDNPNKPKKENGGWLNKY